MPWIDNIQSVGRWSRGTKSLLKVVLETFLVGSIYVKNDMKVVFFCFILVCR
jgi:hypothetical protein